MIRRIKNLKFVYFMVVLLLLGVFIGCSNKSIETNKERASVQNKAAFSNITPEEAKKRLDSGKDIILLDVRTKAEYEEGHIKNSILLPLDNIKAEVENRLKNKEATIFVYCRSGNRSFTAATLLADLGYKNVYNLGGINKWPYEVVK